MKLPTLILIASASLAMAQTRTITVDGSGTVVSPANFWITNNSSIKTALGSIGSVAPLNLSGNATQYLSGNGTWSIPWPGATPAGQWWGLNAAMTVRPSGTDHGLMVISANASGIAIIGQSLNGGPGVKAIQSTTPAVGSALAVYRETAAKSGAPLVAVAAQGENQFAISEDGWPILSQVGTTKRWKLQVTGTESSPVLSLTPFTEP